MKLLVIAVIATGAVCCGFAPSGKAADCASIAADYATALQAARVCDPAVADSCAESRVGSLRDVCRCQVAVNPKNIADLDRLAAEFKAQSCSYDRPVCNLACRVPVHACTVGTGSTPTCAGP